MKTVKTLPLLFVVALSGCTLFPKDEPEAVAPAAKPKAGVVTAPKRKVPEYDPFEESEGDSEGSWG